jgi:hypothetical protein
MDSNMQTVLGGQGKSGQVDPPVARPLEGKGGFQRVVTARAKDKKAHLRSLKNG